MPQVILLIKNSVKLRKPKSGQNQAKKEDKIEVAFLEDGAFEFHAMGVD